MGGGGFLTFLACFLNNTYGRSGSGVIQYFVENLFLYRMRTQGCRESLHFMNFIELD